MNTNPTAAGGPLIMYLIDPAIDRSRADEALAIAHTEMTGRIVTAQADGILPYPFVYGYDHDDGYAGWSCGLKALGSDTRGTLAYRAGIQTVSTFTGSLAANTLLHVVCAEIVHTWQRAGLVLMHRDSEAWVADGRDLRCLAQRFNRFGTPVATQAAEVLQFVELLQQELDRLA